MDRSTAPQLSWRDNAVPVSEAFADPYYSLEDGAAEARHVFLGGNDLPQRFREGFSIAELGFGTGLNLLVTLAAWGDRAGRFRYTSFEAFPLSAEDHRRALARWPDLAQLTAGLCGHIAANRTAFSLGPADVSLIIGDARETLVDWNGRAEAWYLDGFSPARNPELWEPALMAQIAQHTAPGGSFATYSAAGDVRRALGEAGFAVERREGFGRKRHMSVGRLR